MKASKFTLTASDGSRVQWRFWREPRVFNVGGNLEHSYTGPMWMLETHDGQSVGLAAAWLDSVPMIRSKAENYGLETSIS